MRGSRTFLTARWLNLALINYAVDPDVVAPYVPPGCVLDLLDGRAYLSLVAFDFLDTRALGVRWPGFVNFPEINLRLYVRLGEQRGVTFIREMVPRRAVAAIARSIYNEPYRAVPMVSRTTRGNSRISIEHRVRLCGREHVISVSAGAAASVPSRDSTEHFFKEHSWGFGTTRGGRLLRYEVQHPTWAVFAEPKLTLDWDFAAVYGREWSFLNDRAPGSVVLTPGSAVSVFPHHDPTSRALKPEIQPVP